MRPSMVFTTSSIDVSGTLSTAFFSTAASPRCRAMFTAVLYSQFAMAFCTACGVMATSRSVGAKSIASSKEKICSPCVETTAQSRPVGEKRSAEVTISGRVVREPSFREECFWPVIAGNIKVKRYHRDTHSVNKVKQIATLRLLYYNYARKPGKKENAQK
jgi:hypothetical protein